MATPGDGRRRPGWSAAVCWRRTPSGGCCGFASARVAVLSPSELEAVERVARQAATIPAADPARLQAELAARRPVTSWCGTRSRWGWPRPTKVAVAASAMADEASARRTSASVLADAYGERLPGGDPRHQRREPDPPAAGGALAADRAHEFQGDAHQRRPADGRGAGRRGTRRDDRGDGAGGRRSASGRQPGRL